MGYEQKVGVPHVSLVLRDMGWRDEGHPPRELGPPGLKEKTQPEYNPHMQPKVILPILVLSLTGTVFGKDDRLLSVLGLEHHENNSGRPYSVEGETVGQGPKLRYRLGCKLGASDLQVGHRYKITEGSNEDKVRVVSIWYAEKEKPAPDIVGVECEIESVKVITRQ